MIHYGDITKIKGAEVPLVDIVTGGSPCQDLSIAEFNDNDEARAAFWAIVFEQAFEGKSREEFRNMIINLAKEEVMA